jgi:hypothetical protein
MPMKKGRGATMTHDYKRNGTTTLFAGLNPANGEVFGLCQEKHRHQEWLKFLRMIDQTVPVNKEIYLICDNYSTHKHARVQRWLEAHKRFHVHFTPTLNASPRPDPKPHQTRSLSGPRTAHHRDRKLYRRPQQEPQTLHLDSESKRHPRKSHPRSDRPQ